MSFRRPTALIGLWRESDRLAIVSDAVFVWNPFSLAAIPGRVRLPPPVIRPDDAAARASLRRIAELEPSVVWIGHYGPIRAMSAGQLNGASQAD